MARIIVADDERDIRDYLDIALRSAGHEVLKASNGEDVVELASKVHPEFFLLDVRMPRMTGIEACRILKANPGLKDIPVVFFTAKGQDSEIQRGPDAGAEEYWHKSRLLAQDQLADLIKDILKKSRLGIYKE